MKCGQSNESSIYKFLQLQYFPVVLFIMLYKVILTVESVDEIWRCEHSIGLNWKLLITTVLWCCILSCAIQCTKQLELLWMESSRVIIQLSILEHTFSNSLICQEKTKKITTVTVVWIYTCSNFANFSLEFLQEFLTIWEAISNTRKHLSSDIQTARSRLKKLGYASCFQPTSQCLDIWWNILSCVWYKNTKLIKGLYHSLITPLNESDWTTSAGRRFDSDT